MTEKPPQEKWDERFLALAQHIAGWSKDRTHGVGCVIVGPHHEIRSTGFNGFARGVDDDVEERHQRPAKLLWTEHGERNAIYNAARIGVSLQDCTAYVPWFPCADCARALIQSGIKVLVAEEPDLDDPKWGAQFKDALVMLAEAGVELRLYPRE